jgi:hypothetical protein
MVVTWSEFASHQAGGRDDAFHDVDDRVAAQVGLLNEYQAAA